MKDLVPPPIVQNQFESIRELFSRHVVPSYGRFELALVRGEGRHVWDVAGRRYLDLGGGIAVCGLGHAHPAITAALVEQSQRLVHVSNLYYHEPQGRLAERLVRHLAPGKLFFCNSGAEANEGLFKLARRFGHDEGRFEVLTAINSFHGRTLGGIAATGQDKVKKGFEPIIPGFRHVPYNDLAAMEAALSPATAAVLIEGIQGEGGITPATVDYLLGLRQLCDQHRLLLFIDAVQCGHFRTGRFQSFQRLLEPAVAAGVPGAANFVPDGVSMAKALGGGFPIGAFWVRDRHADLFSPGTHGTTFGGTPLGCAVALKIMDIIEQEGLAEHVRREGDWLRSELERLVRSYPGVLRSANGVGFMLGFELADQSELPALAGSDRTAALQFVDRAQAAGLLLIPSGAQKLRLLPPYNLTRLEAEEGLTILDRLIRQLA